MSEHDSIPLITHVLPRKIERPQDMMPVPVNRLPMNMKVVDNSTPEPRKFGLIKILYSITKGLVMKDWKTTVSGIVAAVAFTVHTLWGVYIPEIVTNSVIALALFAIGHFAGDKTSN